MLFTFKRLQRHLWLQYSISPFTPFRTTLLRTSMNGSNPAKRRLSTEHMELTYPSFEHASKRSRESDTASPSSLTTSETRSQGAHVNFHSIASCGDTFLGPYPQGDARPGGSHQRSRSYPHPSKFHQPPLYGVPHPPLYGVPRPPLYGVSHPPLYGVPRPQSHLYPREPRDWQYYAYYRGMDSVRPYGGRGGPGASQWGSSSRYGPQREHGPSQEPGPPQQQEYGPPQEHGSPRERGSPRSQYAHIHRPRAPMRPMVEVNRPRGGGGGGAEDGDSHPTLSLVTYNVLAQDLVSKNPRLYSDCPPEFLCWDYRKVSLLRELLQYSADVLCLQEVEEEHFHSWFKPQLDMRGYSGIYQKRTGVHTDGSAIFYLSSRLALLDSAGVQYQRQTKVLNRDNVGIIGKFATQESNSQTFCVATTHLLFNPKAGDVKLAQLSCLLAELHQLASTSNQGLHPCILCGDFNSVPGSPLLRFIGESRLDYSALSALQIAGYFHDSTASRRIPMPLLPPHLGIGQDCVYRDLPSDMSQSSPSTSSAASNVPHPQTKDSDFAVDLSDFPSLKEAYAKRAEAVEQMTGTRQSTCVLDRFTNNVAFSNSATSSSRTNFTVDPSSAVTDSPIAPSPHEFSRASAQRKPPPGVISHPFTFVPAYPHSAHRPSTITTYHKSAFETVDYIYFTPARATGRRSQRASKGFHLVSRRALPSTHTLLELGPQPHQFLSSDHLALQTIFQLLG